MNSSHSLALLVGLGEEEEGSFYKEDPQRSCLRALETEAPTLAWPGSKAKNAESSSSVPPAGTKAGNFPALKEKPLNLSHIQLNWPGFCTVKILFNIPYPALHGSASFSFTLTRVIFSLSLIP